MCMCTGSLWVGSIVFWCYRAWGSKESIRGSSGSNSSSTAAVATEPAAGNKSEHPRLCCGVDCHEPSNTSTSHPFVQSCHTTAPCHNHYCNTSGCCRWESFSRQSHSMSDSRVWEIFTTIFTGMQDKFFFFFFFLINLVWNSHMKHRTRSLCTRPCRAKPWPPFPYCHVYKSKRTE